MGHLPAITGAVHPSARTVKRPSGNTTGGGTSRTTVGQSPDGHPNTALMVAIGRAVIATSAERPIPQEHGGLASVSAGFESLHAHSKLSATLGLVRSGLALSR
jgi:hypothetical protein